MPVIKIGRRAIASITPTDKPKTYFDCDLKGFGLLVRPSDARSWIIEYRPGAGGRGVAKRRMVLGPCDETMTPEKARDAAKTLLARVRMGADPVAERKEERAAETVKELANAFMKRHVVPKRKASTAAHYRQVIDSHIIPALGSKRAILVTKRDVARLHNDIATKHRRQGNTGDKCRVSKGQPLGGKYVANRTLAIVSAMYGWGAKIDLVPDSCNPARHIEKFEEQPRQLFMLTEEIDRLGAALREAETVGVPWEINQTNPNIKHLRMENRRTVLPAHVTAAIRLLMFTGCRLREILHLEWQQVDFERGVLFLPDSKTGQKTVVLAAPALAVLTSLDRAGRFVIASETAGHLNETPRADLKRPWKLITRRAGLEGLRIHDLRHTFASIGAGSGLGLPLIGSLLGHTDAKTTQKYAHLAVDPMRRAADIIAGQVAGAMGNGPQGADVVLDRREES